MIPIAEMLFGDDNLATKRGSQEELKYIMECYSEVIDDSTPRVCWGNILRVLQKINEILIVIMGFTTKSNSSAELIFIVDVFSIDRIVPADTGRNLSVDWTKSCG